MASTASAADLTIVVGGARSDRGRVVAEVCTPATFLTADCPYRGSATVRDGVAVIEIRELPAAAYAVQAYHDENENDTVDRNILGIPTEGVGFSNDAPIRWAPPELADAVFALEAPATRIALRLRYF